MKGITWKDCLWLQRILLNNPSKLPNCILSRSDILQGVDSNGTLLPMGFISLTLSQQFLSTICITQASGQGLSKTTRKFVTRSGIKSDFWIRLLFFYLFYFLLVKGPVLCRVNWVLNINCEHLWKPTDFSAIWNWKQLFKGDTRAILVLRAFLDDLNAHLVGMARLPEIPYTNPCKFHLLFSSLWAVLDFLDVFKVKPFY